MKALALLIAMAMPTAAAAQARTVPDVIESVRQWAYPKQPPHHVPWPTSPQKEEFPRPASTAPTVTEPITQPHVVGPPGPGSGSGGGTTGKPRIKTTPKEPERRKVRVAHRGMPPCSVVRREYERMSIAERLAAYARASSEEVAYGKRCLGM